MSMIESSDKEIEEEKNSKKIIEISIGFLVFFFKVLFNKIDLKK